MALLLRHPLFIGITIVTILFARADYGSGAVVEYIYDENGNMIGRRTQGDTSAPITTPSPPGGVYNTIQSVSLTCNDGNGWGCDKIYYTTNGSTPTTGSPVY